MMSKHAGVKQLTFEEWNVSTRAKWRNMNWWQHAGDWFFPAPANKSSQHKGKFYHMCETNWHIDMGHRKDLTIPGGTTCCMTCGLEVPDGIKMIAGLLSW